ncbi:hypothetical protein JRQ81_016611, partial [Phrynocephalus forsythii]
ALEKRVDQTELRLKKLENRAVQAEDRQRRKNVRLVGLPELINGKDIIPEVLSLLAANNVEIISGNDIERAHRELRPKPKDSARPRDVIVALCKERLADQLLKESRKKDL